MKVKIVKGNKILKTLAHPKNGNAGLVYTMLKPYNLQSLGNHSPVCAEIGILRGF